MESSLDELDMGVNRKQLAHFLKYLLTKDGKSSIGELYRGALSPIFSINLLFVALKFKISARAYGHVVFRESFTLSEIKP